MDRGAWRATVHGTTKSQTGLKQLSRHARRWEETELTRPPGLHAQLHCAPQLVVTSLWAVAPISGSLGPNPVPTVC